MDQASHVKLNRKNSPLKLFAAARKARASRARGAATVQSDSLYDGTSKQLAGTALDDDLSDEDNEDNPASFLRPTNRPVSPSRHNLHPLGDELRPCSPASQSGSGDAADDSGSGSDSGSDDDDDDGEEYPASALGFWDAGDKCVPKEVHEFAAILSATSAYERNPPSHAAVMSPCRRAGGGVPVDDGEAPGDTASADADGVLED